MDFGIGSALIAAGVIGGLIVLALIGTFHLLVWLGAPWWCAILLCPLGPVAIFGVVALVLREIGERGAR